MSPISKLLGLTVVALVSFALGGYFAGSSAVSGPVALETTEGVDDALSFQGHNARIGRLISALEAMDSSELEEIADLYRLNITMLGECEIRPFADRWAGIDANAALGFFESIHYPTKREVGMKAAMRRVALEDPDSAEQLLNEVQGRRPRLADPLIPDLIAGLAQASPEELSTSLREGRWSPEVSVPTAVGALLKSRGLDFTLEWSSGVIEGSPQELQEIVFRKTVRRAGRVHPEEVAEWVLGHFGAPYAAEGPRIMAEMWQEVDPQAGFDWLLTKVPEEARDRALEFSFARWARERPEEARPWLKARPADARFDPARLSMARLRVKVLPEEALAFCEEVQREDWREKCWVGVARHWTEKDFDEAVAWMEESPLSEEQRAEVIERANRRKLRQRVTR